MSVGHLRGTHSRYVIGCCLIPLGICGLKNNSRRITYGIGCVRGMPFLSPLSSLASNLSWNTETQKVVNKANKIVGFLKRNVGPGNKEVFSRLCNALVIPILEYAVPLWSPYLQKTIDALERVQRRASKYALPMSSRDSPYEERLAMLGWSSLYKEVLSIFARVLQDYSWS